MLFFCWKLFELLPDSIELCCPFWWPWTDHLWLWSTWAAASLN